MPNVKISLKRINSLQNILGWKSEQLLFFSGLMLQINVSEK